MSDEARPSAVVSCFELRNQAGGCVTVIGESMRPDPVSALLRAPEAGERSPSAAAEERSDEGTASWRSPLAAVGCKA
jgi:hypothetical protein